VVVPSQPLGYVYLVIVLQAVYLFKPLLWVVFAGGVYAIWSGSLMIASGSLLDWLYGNLALAFPVLCILVAAVVYARQHQRHEHVQQLLQQMQRRYDALVLSRHDTQQRAALEERSRLSQTIARDISAALAQIENHIASAIGQAHTNLGRFELTVAQTRAAATAAIERMRAAVASLRFVAGEDTMPEVQSAAAALPPDELMTARTQRALFWALPLAFVGIALGLALLQRSVTPVLAALFALFCGALLGGYFFTQRIHNPWLIQLGLAGQATAVLGLVFVTQALPLMLGLLLVLWQICMRLSIGQIVTFVAGVQTLSGLALLRALPDPIADESNILMFCVACIAVAALMGMARRQLGRRREAMVHFVRLADLTDELEQQVAQVRALAAAVERTRMAREIHDDLGHRLMLLNIQLQLVEDLIADDPAAAVEQLSSTGEQLHEAWSSVLNTTDAVLALDGPTLELALHRLIDQCQRLVSVQITLGIHGELAGLDPGIAGAIYRAAQEGLTNVCKYAQAQQVHVLVSYDGSVAEVHVRDDGCGAVNTSPTSPAPGTTGHFGLAGLRERAALLGGAIQTGPLPQGGFALTMTIPARCGLA
ncbi:MAG TPA: histidine kinase, partial [Roseiflexaceae bacterium]|nr:histidine kinase [Roseiflexaceae bacterium]